MTASFWSALAMITAGAPAPESKLASNIFWPTTASGVVGEAVGDR